MCGLFSLLNSLQWQLCPITARNRVMVPTLDGIAGPAAVWTELVFGYQLWLE